MTPRKIRAARCAAIVKVRRRSSKQGWNRTVDEGLRFNGPGPGTDALIKGRKSPELPDWGRVLASYGRFGYERKETRMKVKHWQDVINLIAGLWMIVSPWALAYQAESR